MDPSNPENSQPEHATDKPSSDVVQAQYAGDSKGSGFHIPPRIIIEQQGRTLRRTLFVLLLIALGVSVMFNFGVLAQYQSYIQSDPEITEFLEAGNPTATDKIAVINVDGTIMQGNGFVKKQIDRIKNDEHVKGVVLRVNSPGGTVTASHYIYHHLKELLQKKRTNNQPFPPHDRPWPTLVLRERSRRSPLWHHADESSQTSGHCSSAPGSARPEWC